MKPLLVPLILVSLILCHPAFAQVTLEQKDLERHGPGILTGYTKDEAKKKGGNIWEMEIYKGQIHFAYGGSNNVIWHKFIYFDIKTKTFELGKKPDGEAFVVAEEGIKGVRVFDDGVYFACYDPHSGSRTKQVRLTDKGQWQQLNVTKVDAHSNDFYTFDSILFTHIGNTSLPWPRVGYSRDDGASWTITDQAAEADGKAPAGYLRFFQWQSTLYATGFDRELDDAGKQVPGNEPWMIAYDAGSSAVTFRKAFDSMGDFVPSRKDDFFTPFLDHATAVGGRLVFTIGSNRMYAADSIEPPRLTPLPLPADTVVESIVLDPRGAAWRLLRGQKGYMVEISYDGLSWQGVFDLPNDLPAELSNRTMHFRDLVIDPDSGDVYLSGTDMYLYRVDASLFPLPQAPNQPPADMGHTPAVDMGDGGRDMGGSVGDMSAVMADLGPALGDMRRPTGNGNPDMTSAAGGDTAGSTDVTRSSRNDDGCQMAGAPAASWPWLLLMGGALFCRRRRRG